eukprot:TRINITY_DN1583_c0_g1_i1.p1 TRINITY_DN1583_c0_g1~~TRINITY_DN1583_c0_g1_i1.p1  ORF type:complete len:248 (+),score=74.86 TRINITY_DN1583_c0_g1_i1:189-932(+)
MCIRDSINAEYGEFRKPTMADVTVMEKQLGAKTLQIGDLQSKLTEKMRLVHDLKYELERKDRNIYFLERDMDSRSRSLGKLRLRSNNLEQLAAKQSFGNEIDNKESSVASAKAQTDGLHDELTEAKLRRDHARELADAYEAVTSKLTSNVNAEKVVELLQAELNRVEQQHGSDKQQMHDLKLALTDNSETLATMRGKARFLESYRVDSIFRIFSLKGQARILQQDVNAKVNTVRDTMGIKQRYSHLN